MTLDELKAQAPRTFDKTLIDLLVSIQHGHAPIVTPEPAEIVPRDDTALQAAVLRLASELERANRRIAMFEAVIARLAIEASRDAA